MFVNKKQLSFNIYLYIFFLYFLSAAFTLSACHLVGTVSSHFLLVQTKRKKHKYDEGHETSPQELMEADREVLLKLGRLAFEHLEMLKFAYVSLFCHILRPTD